jgi:hypothetical protein
MGCCDFLTAFSPRFVSFAWRYLGAPAFRPRSAADAQPTDHPGVCCTGCSRSGLLQGTVRISQVPGHNTPSVTIVLRASLLVLQKSHCCFNFLFCFWALSFPREMVDNRPDFANKLEVAASGSTRLDPPTPATYLVLRTTAAHGANPAAPSPVTWAEERPILSPCQIATIHHRPATPPPVRSFDDRGSAHNEIRVSGHSRR